MSIIPSNNSKLQHALAKLTEEETAVIDWRVIIRAHDPAVCDEQWLPWLAWENSIGTGEGWDLAETSDAKRRLIEGYVEKHQTKGTPSAIRKLFHDLGLGDVDILERATRLKWNGEAVFDGKNVFGGGTGDWAKYAIVLKRVITAQQANQIRSILAEITPARCELLYLDFRAQALKWNGEINFDGTYTYGAA